MKASKSFVPAAWAAVFAGIFFLALAWGRWGTGQEKPAAKPAPPDVGKWTAETHDRTNFPLVGHHRTVSCAECHVKGVFEGTASVCESCHWDRRQDDRYRLKLGSHCEDCHTPTAWKNVPPNKWDHLFVSGFHLEGVHKTLDCAECHGEDFKKVFPACVSCHEEDYRNAKEPDHVSAGFPTDCVACHTNQRSWQGARVGHADFALKGRHLAAACSECHPGGQYKGTSSDCVACHLNDYNSTTDPNHKAAGFPTDCVVCHGDAVKTWDDAGFDHNQSFALKGAHTSLSCSECHPGGQYKGTSSDCVACHLNDYNSTTDPDHRAAKFSTDCVACHGDAAKTWEGASLDHNQSFALKGAHTSLACSGCHLGGQYKGTPSDCVACHLEDYNSTKDPDHRAAKFPTDCVACHGDAAKTWEGASLNHNQFFALKGAHTSLACSDCHSKGYDLPKDCYGCHAADYNATTDPNHRASGFPTTCENCHYPAHKAWSQAVFQHDFPIKSGKHGGFSCTECHLTSNFREFSCTDCHTHNKATVDSHHHEVSGYSYNSASCYACHPKGIAED